MNEWEAWRAQVERELKGAQWDKALVTTLREGIRVEPLYTAQAFDPTTDRATPGAAPWTRGALTQDRPTGWFRAMRYVGADPLALATTLAEDLADGMSAVFLPLDRVARLRLDPSVHGSEVGRDGVAIYHPDDMDLVLSGVRARLKVLAMDPGASLPVSVAGFSTVDHMLLGVDPVGALARDGAIPDTLEGSLAAVAEVVKGVWASSTLSAMTVSAEPWESAGATLVEQLAWSVATGVHYVEGLVSNGVPLAQAAGQVTFRVAVGRDIFAEIARLRALRTLWRIALDALGAADPRPVFVHAIGAASTVAARDPWVNMLRATNETFAAIAGGADMITTRAYDEALGPDGPQHATARRVARNTQIILDEESHLGHVIDPLGGSYYVESLTRSLARAAWDELASLESSGGVVAAVMSGELQRRCQKSWQARRDGLAKRREAVTGVSEFANVHETRPLTSKSHEGRHEGYSIKPQWQERPPAVTAPRLEAHREAEVFEALRDRADGLATRPVAYLATLGQRAGFAARAAWSQGFFAAGGFAVIEDPGSDDGGLGAWAARAKASGAAVVCVCGSDASYEAQGADGLAALKAQGLTASVYWAQKPGGREAELRAMGVRGFIFLGCDVAMTLEAVLAEVSL